ncbi:hypothetical protein [Clostridium botulinum]|uniref:hypothetical protein n=1 Tax=Clostridium botulinum TaxID=1491 RepID=UPI001C9A2F1E|nr:hypothetical protein [Clostridium botulinum]MBY6838680.1 hypothetical protein [Clostridium botulinum]
MNKDKIETVIYSTMDYDKFKFIKSNRSINRSNVENLKESMIKKALPKSVTVNEKYEIIDGQHSFTARKELGLPIVYQIMEGAGEDEMITLNVNKANWKPIDYLNYFCDNEYNNYIEFKKIKDKYKITISDLLTIFDTLSNNKIGENARGRLFKEGKLDMSNKNEVILFLNDLQLFSSFDDYISTYFIRAFLRLYSSDFYDSSFMKRRCELSEAEIKSNTKGYTDKQCEFLSLIYTDSRKGIYITYVPIINGFAKVEKRK